MTAESASTAATRVETSGASAMAQRTPIAGAGRLVTIAAALGICGQLLFFDVGIGVNVPVAVLLLVAAGWALRRRGQRLAVFDAWLPAAALGLATFAALRADATLVALDAFAALLLTGASLTAFAGHAVMRRRALDIAALGLRLISWIGGGARYALSDAFGGGDWVGQRARTAAPVVRGLVLAVPLLGVFIALFAAADAVFARAIEHTLRVDFGSVPGRALLALLIAWAAGGALAFIAGTRPEPVSEHAATDRAGGGEGSGGVGLVEATIVLASVDVVFAIFVALQAAYLFGGLDTLAASGLTYSDYARRGFFELIAVAFVAGGVLVALEAWVRRRPAFYVASGVTLAALTGVVLVSAAYRMRLYQEAYGWTELRFYALAIIAWLALGVVAATVTLLTARTHRLPHVMVASAVAVALVVSVMGPVRFVAEQNVARAVDPSLVPADGVTGLDTAYLWSLDDDAVEPLLTALPRLDAETRRAVAAVLDSRLRQLSRDPTTWQDWSLGRAGAAELLRDAARRGELER